MCLVSEKGHIGAKFFLNSYLKRFKNFGLKLMLKAFGNPIWSFYPLSQCQQQYKKYLVKLLRCKNFECNLKKCLALLHCRAMALKLALKPICMKPYLTFWAFSDFSRTQMDYVTSKSLVNQRCKIAEKYLAKLKYFFPKIWEKDAKSETCFKLSIWV